MNNTICTALLAFVFGLLIGSFLNVCIYRLPRDLSVVTPRSHCVHCQRTLAWYENIPVASYLALRGRCRSCGARISPRYPIVELLTAALFGAYFLIPGPVPAAFKSCLLGALLIGLTFADLEQRILPDEFTLGGAAAGVLLAWFIPVQDLEAHALFWIFGIPAGERWLSVAESLLGALLPSAFLWLGGYLYWKLRHREGLGLGDVKLMMMVGAFLGLRGALFTLIAGSVVGSLIGYSYIRLTGKDAATYELPFGTFLGAAGIAVSLAWPKLAAWG